MAEITLKIDQDAQAAYFAFGDRPVDQTVEVNDSVLLDLDEFGVVIGIELLELNASLLRDSAIPQNWHMPAGVWQALMSALPVLSARMTTSCGDGGMAGTGNLSYA